VKDLKINSLDGLEPALMIPQNDLAYGDRNLPSRIVTIITMKRAKDIRPLILSNRNNYFPTYK
jgi:hypothetical protein